jgi:hypothetical protein
MAALFVVFVLACWMREILDASKAQQRCRIGVLLAVPTLAPICVSAGGERSHALMN